jgi:hypothetical protein
VKALGAENKVMEVISNWQMALSYYPCEEIASGKERPRNDGGITWERVYQYP